MKGLAYEMAVAGKSLEDNDFISYVLAGLNQDYNSFVENVAGKTEISLGDLYSQLLAAEARLDLQTSHYPSSVNTAARGRGGFGRGFPGHGGGRRGSGRSFGVHGGNGSSLGTKPICQLCKKTGHTVLHCWKCFDRNFMGEEKMENNTKGPSYNVDPAWYSDTGATNHITSELDKLIVMEKYNRQDQIRGANGGGMHSAHVGQSTLFTTHCNLSLKHVLHVPSSQNILFIFVALPVIIMCLLNIILMSFSLRIPPQGSCFFEACVRAVSIPSLLWSSPHPRPSLP
jgi:hypothetical protein